MRAGRDVKGNESYSGGEKRMRLTVKLTFSISVGERGGSGDGREEEGEEGDSPLMESSMEMDDCL